jgi:hypothetical protein
MTVVRKLLPVVGQNLRAGVAQPGPVLLQARQHDLVAIIHLSAAKPRDIPRAGVMALLRRRRRGHQNKRHDEKNSGHLLCLQISSMNAIKFRRSKSDPKLQTIRDTAPNRSALKSTSQRILFLHLRRSTYARQASRRQADDATTGNQPRPIAVAAMRSNARSGDRERGP